MCQLGMPTTINEAMFWIPKGFSMAMTHDYLDYLDQEIGISPANSQEELDAARTIAELMEQHHLEAQVEEFSYAPLEKLVPQIARIAMFIGLILCATSPILLKLLGFLLACVPAVFVALRFLGISYKLPLPKKGISQNVIALHKAEGPLVSKGNRPIVLVAHYDAPNENILYTTAIASYFPLIHKAARWGILVVALAAFVQILLFLPGVFRAFFFAVGFIAAVPVLFLAISCLIEHFSNCTVGANDNKAAVAAMLGVLEHVRPSGMTPKPRPQGSITSGAADAADAAGTAADAAVDADADGAADVAQGFEEDDQLDHNTQGNQSGQEDTRNLSLSSADASASKSAQPEVEANFSHGVRHGADTLRTLGILPVSCKITYVGAEAEADHIQQSTQQDDGAAAFGADAEQTSYAQAEDTNALRFRMVLGSASDQSEDGLKQSGSVPAQAPDPTLNNLDTTTAFDASVAPAPPKDTSGLDRLAPIETERVSQTQTPAPTHPADPNWGKSSFEPTSSTFSRRATLVDLPDPSAHEKDPLETSGNLYSFTENRQASSQATLSEVPIPSQLQQSQHALLQQNQNPLSELAEDTSFSADAGRGFDASAQSSSQQSGKGLFSRIKQRFHKGDPSETQVRPRTTLEDDNSDAQARENIRNTRSARNIRNTQDTAAADSAKSLNDAKNNWRGGAALKSNLRLVNGEQPAGQSPAASAADPSADRKPFAESNEQTEATQQFSATEALQAAGAALTQAAKASRTEDSETNTADEGVSAPDQANSEQSAQAITPQDMAEEVMKLGDDNLINHDIWFVAAGASHHNHAGIKAFLEAHRRQVRGCFFINLSCVGAGDLSVLTREGLEESRRADRRLLRLCQNTADTLHIAVDEKDYSWCETDATVAMRSAVRSITLMGVDEHGLPALSQTPADVIENVDADQAALACEVVTEIIRRS